MAHEVRRSSSPPSPTRVTRGQRRALGVLAIAAFVGFLWVALPVAFGLFLGTLVAFTIEPLYGRMCARWRRPALAAVVCALGCTLAIAGSIAGLAVALAARGSEVATATAGGIHHALGPIERLLRRAHVEPGDLASRIRGAATEALGRAATAIATLATFTVHALLTLFFFALSTYFVLRHWSSLTLRLERMLPLNPMHTHLLLRQFRRAGRSILLGTIVTGAAQGVFAAVGFALFGVPAAPLLGALTAIASLVPAVGTLAVWVPAAIWLFARGHVGAGIGLLVYCGATVIVACDYLLRPHLVGRTEREVPSLITFIALFGGVEVFGVTGLVLGPVLVSFCVAVLRTWEEVAVGRAEQGPALVEEEAFLHAEPAHEERLSH